MASNSFHDTFKADYDIKTEKYFGYIIPRLDIYYLNKKFKHIFANAFNSFVGQFNEAKHAIYEPSLILVKVSLKPLVAFETTKNSATDFIKLHYYLSSVKRTFVDTYNPGYLNKYNFEYYIFPFQFDRYDLIQLKSFPKKMEKTEALEQILLICGKSWKAHDLEYQNKYRETDYHVINICDNKLINPFKNTKFIMTPEHICGIINYICSKQCIEPKNDMNDYFYNYICTNSEQTHTCDVHEINTGSKSIICDYVASLAIGDPVWFKCINIYDVIGPRLKKVKYTNNTKYTHKFYWYRDNTINFMHKIINILNHKNTSIIKFNINVQTYNDYYILFKYDIYIHKSIYDKYFASKNIIEINKLLKLQSNIDYTMKIFGKHKMRIGNNIVHLNESSNILKDAINDSYNPVLTGLDGCVLDSSIDSLTNYINTVFPQYMTQIQMTPFSYQMRNIIWMYQIENNIKCGKHTITIPYGKLAILNICNDRNDDYRTYRHINKYQNIYQICDDKYICSHYHDTSKLLKLTDEHHYTLPLTGGLICDDVGLGKTFSLISYLLTQKTHDDSNNTTDSEYRWTLNNCIIVPSRLVQQWKYEIHKYCGDNLSVVTIGSIVDVKKLYNKTTGLMIQKYDIYIISSTLLSNENYTEYLRFNITQDNSIKPKSIADIPPYNVNVYFDIFQIKWNRLICDEAHEKIISTRDWDDSESSNGNVNPHQKINAVTLNLIFNITANFRWGLTATPFENRSNNIIGYILWLAKNIKCDFRIFEFVTEMYFGADTPHMSHLYNTMINALPEYMTPDFIRSFQYMTISKTSKKSVAPELNIPIFTENIIMVDISQIERNIYNNARASIANDTDAENIKKIKRLFQLCTNINISDVDMVTLNIDTGKILSLEELNISMVNNFETMLKTINRDEKIIKKKYETYTLKNKLAKELKTYIETDILPGISTIMDSYEGHRITAFISKCSSYDDSSVSVVERAVIMSIKTDLYTRLDECLGAYFNLFVIVNELLQCDIDGKVHWSQQQTILIVYHFICEFIKTTGIKITHYENKIAINSREIVRLENQIKLFKNNDFMTEKTADPCIICWADYDEASTVAISNCRHLFCEGCFKAMAQNKRSFPCPECRADIICKDIKITAIAQLTNSSKPEVIADAQVTTPADWKTVCISKYGTKMTVLIDYLRNLFGNADTTNARVIIFSQYNTMLKMIALTLDEYNISHVNCRGNVNVVNKNITRFKQDKSIRVIMLSSEHCNSGCNLTEASHIILVDVLNMDASQTKDVECQAIGRAVRLGQKQPVTVVRLITRNTIEEEYYNAHKYDIASIQ